MSNSCLLELFFLDSPASHVGFLPKYHEGLISSGSKCETYLQSGGVKTVINRDLVVLGC